MITRGFSREREEKRGHELALRRAFDALLATTAGPASSASASAAASPGTAQRTREQTQETGTRNVFFAKAELTSFAFFFPYRL